MYSERTHNSFVKLALQTAVLYSDKWREVQGKGEFIEPNDTRSTATALYILETFQVQWKSMKKLE